MNCPDLLNSEKLDEGVSNLINESLLDGLTENTSLLNADGAEYSYASAYVNPDTIKAGVDLTTSLVKATSSGRERRSEGSCLRPAVRESFFNRKKWEEYRKCKEEQAKDEERARAIESERTEQERLALERARISQESGSDKFLGMPKAVGITVAVVGGLALVVGGIFLVKKLRK